MQVQRAQTSFLNKRANSLSVINSDLLVNQLGLKREKRQNSIDTVLRSVSTSQLHSKNNSSQKSDTIEEKFNQITHKLSSQLEYGIEDNNQSRSKEMQLKIEQMKQTIANKTQVTTTSETGFMTNFSLGRKSFTATGFQFTDKRLSQTTGFSGSRAWTNEKINKVINLPLASLVSSRHIPCKNNESVGLNFDSAAESMNQEDQSTLAQSDQVVYDSFQKRDFKPWVAPEKGDDRLHKMKKERLGTAIQNYTSERLSVRKSDIFHKEVKPKNNVIDDYDLVSKPMRQTIFDPKQVFSVRKSQSIKPTKSHMNILKHFKITDRLRKRTQSLKQDQNVSTPFLIKAKAKTLLQNDIYANLSSQKALKSKETLQSSTLFKISNRKNQISNGPKKQANLLQKIIPEEYKDDFQNYCDSQDQNVCGNIFEICSKRPSHRSQLEINELVNYMQKNFEIFRNDFANDELKQISTKLVPIQYNHNELIIKEGDFGNFLVILIEGKLQVLRPTLDKKVKEEFGALRKAVKSKLQEAARDTRIIKNEQKVKSNTWGEDNDLKKDRVIAVRSAPDLLGEAALKANARRQADVCSVGYARCLLLFKSDFDSALTVYLIKTRKEKKKLLQNVEILRDWNSTKLGSYGDSVTQIDYEQGQTIYSLGDATENVFIVKKGKIQLEVFYVVVNHVYLPTEMHEYQTKCCSQIVKRVVRTIGRGQQFGFEEIINLQKTRLIRAKVISPGGATCLFIGRKKFFQYMFKDEISKYIDMCAEYTNFDQEGRNLVAEMYVAKMRTNTFLDGAKFTPFKQQNYRSQEKAVQPWLGNNSFSLHSMCCEQRLHKYIKCMRGDSTAAQEKTFEHSRGRNRLVPDTSTEENKDTRGTEHKLDQVNTLEEIIQIDNQRKLQVIAQRNCMLGGVADSHVRAERERHEMAKFESKVIQEDELDPYLKETRKSSLIDEVRNTDRRDLPKIIIEPCVDENGMKVKLIESKDEIQQILDGKNVR